MDPVLYHAHHSRHVEDLPFWQRLAAAQGSPILELGCGTGRVLRPLAANGHHLFGLDRDAGMLAYLRSRLQPGERAHLVQGDLRRFAFRVRFPLVILPCNTLSTLSAADRDGLYQCVFRHLELGGLFAAGMPNPAILADLPAEGEPTLEEVFPHPADQAPVQVSSAWDRNAGQLKVSWFYDHLRADGTVTRTTVVQTHRIIPVSTLVEALARAGFELGATYGDYDHTAYTHDSPFWILTARRPG